MASERDLELLDDYLGNRLSSADRVAFENRLQADPDLQRELKFQGSIVESIRKARVAELKAMLNNIPPSAIPNNTSSLVKWSSLAISAIIGVGLYFYLKPEQPAETTKVTDSANVTAPPVEGKSAEPAESAAPVVEDQKKTEEKPATNGHAGDKKSAPKAKDQVEPKPRELDVFDPEAEITEEATAPEVEMPEVSNATAKTSDITSEIVSDHKTYTFHYQFKDDKLILYGSFDKNLYSILEFFSDNKRTVFLEYKNNFYLLNQAGDKVKPLSPVNDPVLIQKLREH